MKTIISKRAYSEACKAKFYPLKESYGTLRHIHFPGITLFEKGQKIQDAIVNANLDFKKMESRITKQMKVAESQMLQLNDYERGLLKKIFDMKPLPTLLTFEFEDVYTGGRKEKQDPDLPKKIKEYEAMGCKYHQLKRGGKTTWHGHGQLTAYTILDLKQFKSLTVKCFVDSILLQAIQNVLKKYYGLNSFRNENPGVWMAPNDQKIASVGCNIQRAVTSYGISLNVNPDLKFLNKFVMCGLAGTSATSIAKLRPDLTPTVQEVGHQYAIEVAKLLHINNVQHMDGEGIEI